MPTLTTAVDGMTFPNPFLIGSGPPGTNAKVIGKAYREGWGGVVAKTVTLDASKIVNVAPRYAKLTAPESREIYGWSNIELIATTEFSDWLDDFKAIKDAFPDRPLIASVMEEHSADAWAEVVGRSDEAGVDGFELNLSCPHGLPERRMGSAIGEDAGLTAEAVAWAVAATDKPVWAKMTPNVTRVEDPAGAALRAGASGVTVINTVRSLLGVDLETLRPLPTVEGHGTYGGYSSAAVKPIALRMTCECRQLMSSAFGGRGTISGMGGVETGGDAAEFLLLGADTVQVCTGVMKRGYRMVGGLVDGLLSFMDGHGFETLEDFKGRAVPYVTTHAELVRLQAEAQGRRRALAAEAASLREQSRAQEGLTAAGTRAVVRDENWDADAFVRQSEELAGN